MDNLNDKKNKILLIEEEIKALEAKKKKLKKLKTEYYNEYFKTKREDYALLTDIPDNPMEKKNLLTDYSVLNIDEIGKIICDLFKCYENKDLLSKRLYYYDRWENAFGYYPAKIPIQVIGKPENIDKYFYNEENIIINYEKLRDLKKYPTDLPVEWQIHEYGLPVEGSNYDYFIMTDGDLKFDYKNREFIKELIYSLAYYQKEHNLKMMSASDTQKVYKKIYKK